MWKQSMPFGEFGLTPERSSVYVFAVVGDDREMVVMVMTKEQKGFYQAWGLHSDVC
jgi:hypothetical protein